MGDSSGTGADRVAWLGVGVVLTALVRAWASVPLPESVLMAF
ncbi:MAG TPA: hypothetical protein VEY13_08195 [Rubrobacteraceae bacterium]|nr:hypothetical protein [Rubrobacteraceae bacterium]